jgi:sugar/nucleoside kinase (ribokinase family)
MEEAMRRACLVASVSVTRAGTMGSYPSRDEATATIENAN